MYKFCELEYVSMGCNYRIGIRYCGGCNPQIDRSGVVDALRGELASRGLDARLVIQGQEPVELVILINGCTHACLEEELSMDRTDVNFMSVRGEMIDDQYISERDLASILATKVMDFFSRHGKIAEGGWSGP